MGGQILPKGYIGTTIDNEIFPSASLTAALLFLLLLHSLYPSP
jgi:hypothetical protein